jgi:K+-transporting ATPase ATPase A chain
MTAAASAQLFGLLTVLLLTVRPLGGYLKRVFAGEVTLLSPMMRPIEAAVYALAEVKRDKEQGWFDYAMAFLLVHLPGMLLLYALLRLQNWLPLNPAGQPAVAADLALNTAVSFATNTSWQSHGGETALGHLTQMAGIGVQSFLSGAAGIAVAIALIRGLARHGITTIGNFWVDLTRATLYVMLPICLLAALFLAWQGVPDSLAEPIGVATLDGAQQTIAIGPVALQ